MNTVIIAIVLAVAIEAIKRVFALLGKPITPQIQFFISLFSPIIPILAGGAYGDVAAVVRDFGELFAAVQAVYNIAKQIGRLIRRFRS